MPRGRVATTNRKRHHWTPADIAHMRWYASRGFSAAETGAVMGLTKTQVLLKSAQCGIHYHGIPGAPFLNDNGAVAAVKSILRATTIRTDGKFRSRRDTKYVST